MEIVDPIKYAEAFKNVENFNFTRMSYKEIFDEMRQMLVYAFDDVTVFDMRRMSQIQLILDDCYIGLADEKDLKTYPAIVLGLEICDWDIRNNCKDTWRKSNFQLKLTPFRCCLDKAKETTGVYGGYDKDLTRLWRTILKDKYPEYEQGLKRYAIEVRDLKIEQAKREYEAICNKADEEYNEEFDLI